MKNLYFFLAGAAMLVSGLFINDSGQPPISELQKAALVTSTPASKSQSIVPFKRKKADKIMLFAPTISATNTYALTNDTGLPGASVGDELEYTVTITNSGTDASGVTFTDQIDANTTLVAGSLKVSPIAQNDVYNAIGNVGLDIPAGSGVLVNDSSPNGASISIVGSGEIATSQGGAVTIDYSTGAFTYLPAAGFTGNDTFTYTLQNGSGLTSTATVTIATTSAIWFVNSAASASGENGTLAKPFTSLAGFAAINDGAALHPQAGHSIFLYEGNYTGPVSLLNQQKVIGQGAGASLLAISGYSTPSGNNLLPATGGNRPALTSSGGANVITTAAANTIRGLNIGNSGGAKIAGSTAGLLTISEIALTGNGSALNLANVTLAADFSELSSNVGSGPVSPIDISSVGGNLKIGSGTISSSNVAAIDVAGSSLGLDVTLAAVSCSNAAKGIAVSGTTGTFQITGSGATAGSGGTIQNISARGIEFTNAAGVTLNNINLINANGSDSGGCGTSDNSGCNAAVYANVVNGFKLERIIITGTTNQHGINLRGVNNLTISNSSVQNAGNAATEGAIFATNTTGTASITNSTFANSTIANAPSGRVAYFGNTDSNLSLLTVDNSDFTDSPNNGGILMEGYGNSQMNLKITGGSQFLRCETQGIKMISNNNSQLVGDIQGAVVNNLALNGVTRLTSIGIDLQSTGTSSLKYNIIGNNFRCKNGTGINLKVSNNSTHEGTVDGNTVVSDGGGGSGIYFDTEGPTAKGIVKISNNTVSGILNDFGIGFSGYVTNSNTKSDLSIIGNTITTGPNAFNDIDVNFISSFSDNQGKLCTYIASNNVAAATGVALRLRPGAPGNQIILQGAGNTLQAVWSGNGNTPQNAFLLSGGSGTTSYNTGQTCAVPNVSALRIAAEETALRQGSLDADNVSDSIQSATAISDTKPEGNTNEPNQANEVQSNTRTAASTAGETVTVNGTGSGFSLPAGANVIVKFKVTVNNDIPVTTCEVTNQGSVSGNDFSTVLTDDPGAPGSSDPTITAIVSAPVISACPTNQVVDPDAGACTATLSLPATVAGCPAPTVVYSVSGSPITFPYIFPAGVTTVEVNASNGIGTDATCSFTVTVTPTPAPVISQDPQDQLICAGQDASFTVAATGVVTNYRWQKKPFGGAFSDIDASMNPSANTATLALTNVPVTDNNSEYQCIVSNPCNSVTSAAATLTVNEITASTISGTATVDQGASAPVVTFGVTGGTLPYTFTYKINDGTATTIATAGAATTVGVTQSTASVGVFTYELVSVTDAQGCTLTPASAQTAVITVANSLTASISAGSSACVGAVSPQVTFTAVDGVGPFTFTYKLNAGPDLQVTTTGANTTASVAVSTAAAGSFTYELINVSGAGDATTAVSGQSATVVVNETPTITLGPDAYSCSFNLNTYSVVFTATAGATVTTDKGTISGNSVIDIPSNETAVLTVTKDGCSSTLSVFRDCTLPVTLIDFSASRQENAVVLKWRTSEETNSEKFEIERSVTGKNWETIATKKSGGESSVTLNYTFKDDRPNTGDNFYRLKMIDTDQTFAYSHIVFVGIEGAHLLEIYPNPVSDLLSIKTNSTIQISSVELHNVKGVQVHKSQIGTAKTVSVGNLPAGIYVLSIYYQNGKIDRQKVLISR
ncbi:Ig-like domain-containing protein [Dyadobacter chenhuakuii]|uniref:Ig-like domain-containing protein n=1 Tax=Dyadobacter chenhuakuii TaxID=2909339 RepID=A0ABY4XQL2_9BACT|nr:T9SS type A sorting domain-containing protein [Dyadobacter chenhuakuii]MCF2493014.1 Ig-like domain-containing protein [Dyadobacter chenhuakuii]USJ32698.1 Ig-like domain-containing protein [Dyadobacter chenhuakuii]